LRELDAVEAAAISFRASCFLSFNLALKQSGWLQRSERTANL
jgi:hypothetical protein